MNTTIRGSHSGLRMAIALVAVLFVVALAFAVHQVATTSEPDLRYELSGTYLTHPPLCQRSNARRRKCR